MAALTGLSTAIFAKNSYKNWTPSRLPHPGRPEICFSGSPNFKKVEFDHHLILFRPIGAPPLVCKSYVTSDAEVLTSLETAVSGIDNTRSSNTVHVRFQLQKECKFGDHFLLVGNDPAIGLWDPSCAIPLIWSDGHIWTVELDLCVDLTMQFKFILKQGTGEVIWQPGPDRIFKAWESMNSIVVAEDWENAEAQKIMEEQTMNPDLEPVLAGSISLRSEELMANVNKDAMFGGNNIAYAADNLNVNNEFISTENVAYPAETYEKMKAEGSVSNRKEMLTNNNNHRSSLPGKNSVTAPDEEKMYSYEEGHGHVLVPGLTPLQVASTEEVLTKELESIIADASLGIDAVKD